jgi:hypothetical protein
MTSGDSTRCADVCGKACADGDNIDAATKTERIVASFDIVLFPHAGVASQPAKHAPTQQPLA